MEQSRVPRAAAGGAGKLARRGPVDTGTSGRLLSVAPGQASGPALQLSRVWAGSRRQDRGGHMAIFWVFLPCPSGFFEELETLNIKARLPPKTVSSFLLVCLLSVAKGYVWNQWSFALRKSFLI